MAAFGYICRQFTPGIAQLEEARIAIRKCAAENGYALGEIYEEETTGSPVAIFYLMGAVMESAEQITIVPTLHHLAILGNPLEIRENLQAAGHVVLIAQRPN